MASADQVLEREKLWLGGNVGMSYGPVQVWYNANVGNIGAYGWPCCQAFQTMCNTEEGAGAIIPQTASCSNAASWYQARGLYGYEPQYGAQVFFDWGDGGILDHVGFVYAFDASYVYTIEGNTSNTVAYRSYPRNSVYIRGYGYTQYGGSTPAPTPSHTGSYVTMARSDGVWRTAPDSTKANTVPGTTYAAGSQVEVVGWVYGNDPYGTGQNKWVKSKVRGLYCWQGNLQSIGHLSRVDSGGGQTAPAKEAYVTTARGDLYWRSAPSTSAAIFPGTPYYQGARILCNGWRRAEDPYGDGRNIWVRSVLSGQWAWAGGLSEDVTAILVEV